MMRVLLDTSAYVAMKIGHPGVASLVRQASEIHVNTIVLGELYAGFRGGNREARNIAQLHDFLSSPRVEVADLDQETAVRYGVIRNTLKRNGTPIPTNDIWIAATAMQHGLEVVTLDRHFLKVPQILVNHFAPR